MPEKELFEILGAPESEDLVRVDGQPLTPGVPRQLVKAAGWDNWIDEDDEDIRVIDFGEVFIQGSQPDSLAQPPDLRAPETIFTDQFDHRLDLWRAGVTVRYFHQMCIVHADIDIYTNRFILFCLDHGHSSIGVKMIGSSHR